MNDIDGEWAVTSLRDFIYATDQVSPRHVPGSGVVYLGTVQRLENSEAAERAYVAERILDRVLPQWRASDTRSDKDKRDASWEHLRQWASRGVAALEREAEIREKLGDSAPRLSAGDLHPWVWQGARSLWQSDHYREAVEAASRKLNAETQNKVGRRDISETELFKQAFTVDPPLPNKSRLRRLPDDGSKTYQSVQRGAMAFAEGVFAGIRNPLSHEAEHEMSEGVALEYLAALSVLARWVDESIVETV